MARRSRGSPTRGSALELAAVKDQSDRDPEERSEKGRPDGEPPLLWDRTKEGDAAAAAERADERDEAERTDEGAAPGEGALLRSECFTPLFLRARASFIGLSGPLLVRVAPLAPASSPSHRPRLYQRFARKARTFAEGTTRSPWRTAGAGPGYPARVRARQHLGGYACAADHDPAPEPHVEARGGKVFHRRIHAKGQLADRVRSVRGGGLDAPGLALDGHTRVIRARNGPVERRPYDPATDYRRNVDVAIRGQMEQPPVDGGGKGPRKTSAGPREKRPSGHLASDRHTQLALHVGRLQAKAAGPFQADRRAERHAGSDHVPGVHGLADGRSLDYADGQGMVRAPARVPPGHATPIDGRARSVACHRDTAGIRSASRFGSTRGRPRASIRAPSAPA